MIIVKDYNKPTNCYYCPGFNKEHYYCAFNPRIDFDYEPYEPVPNDCPIIEVSPRQVQIGEWIAVDPSHDAFDCSNCTAMVRHKVQYCPKCGSYMTNGETR